MKTLNFEDFQISELSNSDLSLINGGTAEDVGYAVGWTVGFIVGYTLFGVVAAAYLLMK